MPSKVNVYKLKRYYDDSRFEGFSSKHVRKGWLPPPGHRSKKWRPSKLAGTWVDVRATGRVRRFNDYPCLDWLMPAFSFRAVEVLGDLLEVNGELLPSKTCLGTYFAFNVTTVADVLDARRSKIELLEIWLCIQLQQVEKPIHLSHPPKAQPHLRNRDLRRPCA